MKKKNLFLSLFVLCLFVFQTNDANAGYIHSIQLGGDGNKETIEYFEEEKEEKTNQNTTINYNYITPVSNIPTYYADDYYTPYTTSTRYRVITTYPYIGATFMPPPPPRHHLHHGHRPPPPRHHLNHGHRPPPPMHRPHHRNRVHIGVPGLHVSF